MGELKAKGVDLYLHQQSLDTSTPAGKAMFQMLGVFSEFEREIIRERVNSGLARAKAQGKKLGRPRRDTPKRLAAIRKLRKRGIGKIILGGMLANMCVESHLRELLEQGFEVAIVKDATAGPRHPVWGDGYQAAIINYRFLAHAVLSTDETVARMHQATR